jgi:hypothetical protein
MTSALAATTGNFPSRLPILRTLPLSGRQEGIAFEADLPEACPL